MKVKIADGVQKFLPEVRIEVLALLTSHQEVGHTQNNIEGDHPKIGGIP